MIRRGRMHKKLCPYRNIHLAKKLKVNQSSVSWNPSVNLKLRLSHDHLSTFDRTGNIHRRLIGLGSGFRARVSSFESILASGKRSIHSRSVQLELSFYPDRLAIRVGPKSPVISDEDTPTEKQQRGVRHSVDGLWIAVPKYRLNLHSVESTITCSDGNSPWCSAIQYWKV